MRYSVFLLLILVLTSCAQSAMPTATTIPTLLPTAMSSIAPTVQLSPSPQPNFMVHPDGARIELDLWVDDPTPTLGSYVTVRGSIIRNGVRLGGLMMRAEYPVKDGTKQCDVLIIYGAGVCTLPVRDYVPGVFLPITVTFDYDGVRYTGQTGFTPRQP
nr:hypothetical protein [Chloroflexota bacterium]